MSNDIDYSSLTHHSMSQLNGIYDKVIPQYAVEIAAHLSNVVGQDWAVERALSPRLDPLSAGRVILRVIFRDEGYLEKFANSFTKDTNSNTNKYPDRFTVTTPKYNDTVYIRPPFCFNKSEIKKCKVNTIGEKCFTIEDSEAILGEVRFLTISDYGSLWAYDKQELEDTIDEIRN